MCCSVLQLRRIFWVHKNAGNFGRLKVTRFLWNPPIPLLHPNVCVCVCERERKYVCVCVRVWTILCGESKNQDNSIYCFECTYSIYCFECTYLLHRFEIPTEILLKMKLFRPKPATPLSVEPFVRILRAVFISQCPYKFSSFLDLRNALNRFRLFSRDFRLFRFFFPGSARFSTLASPRNLPSWVKYYGKFESFGTEFRRTKFIAVERVTF